MTKNEALLLSLSRLLNVDIECLAVVGSTLIQGQGTDVDVLCFSTTELDLEAKGFELDNPLMASSYPTDFTSYRGNGVNLLHTDDPEYFVAELVAAHSARLVAQSSWDMSERDARIDWHSILREIAERFRKRPLNVKSFDLTYP